MAGGDNRYRGETGLYKDYALLVSVGYDSNNAANDGK